MGERRGLSLLPDPCQVQRVARISPGLSAVRLPRMCFVINPNAPAAGVNCPKQLSSQESQREIISRELTASRHNVSWEGLWKPLIAVKSEALPLFGNWEEDEWRMPWHVFWC